MGRAKLPLRAAIVLLGCLPAFSTVCAQADESSIRAGHRPQLEEAGFGFELPFTIRRADLDRYAQILVLSDAQMHFATHLFDEYGQEAQQIDRKHIPSLLELAKTVVDGQGNPNAQWQILSAVLQIRAIERALREDLERHDDLFFAKLGLILADIQKPFMERVVLHRKRSRCNLQFQNCLRKSHIDLSAIIEKSQWPAEIRALFDSVLWEYEQALTPLWEIADKKLKESKRLTVELDRQEAFDEIGQPLDWSRPDSLTRAQAARSEARRIRYDCVEALKSIGRLNDEWLPKIMAPMPPAVAKSFRLAYLSMVYRRVYPDMADPEILLEKIVASDGMSLDLRLLLESAWTEYRRGYSAICKSMCDETDRWQEFGALENSTDGWREHNAMMRRWTEERMKKNKEFVDRIESFLPSEIRVIVAPFFAEWKHTLTETQEEFHRRRQDYAFFD